MKCELLPSGFAPVANAWGAQGWTTTFLAELSDADLASALELAWQHALPVRVKAARKSK